jgi:hypothetical protein
MLDMLLSTLKIILLLLGFLKNSMGKSGKNSIVKKYVLLIMPEFKESMS